MASPHITPVQLENEVCPFRFSACTYPQQGNFDEEHCKGLASKSCLCGFDAHAQPKKKEKKNMFCPCCISVSLFLSVSESLCFVVLLCICIYTNTFS